MFITLFIVSGLLFYFLFKKECKKDEDCEAGKECKENKCEVKIIKLKKKKLGESCGKTEDCEKKLKCSDDKKCVVCVQDNDCTETCKPSDDPKKCRDNKCTCKYGSNCQNIDGFICREDKTIDTTSLPLIGKDFDEGFKKTLDKCLTTPTCKSVSCDPNKSCKGYNISDMKRNYDYGSTVYVKE